MAGKTHSVLLAHGLKRLDEKKTYILGFISVKQLQDPWKAFTKNMIRNLSEAQGSNVEIDMLISRSYGKSIEKIGVTPDEKLLPTAADLAAKRDIVLARAAEILGFKMTAEEAGKVFPNEYESNH